MAVNHEQAKTREEYKKRKHDEPNKEEPVQPSKKRIRIRLIPIWLRLVLLVVFIIVSSIVGAVVGYGMLGNGNPKDVFKESTWTHIHDLVDKGK